jgi:hypothetical protein
MPRDYVQLHTGALDSDRVAQLDDFAYRVWINSLIACDFAGRLDARAERLRSALFPLGTEKRTAQIQDAIQRLVDAGLVMRYEANGRPFLQLTRQRACGNAQNAECPWVDGSHRITYVERPTRDGPRQFVASSLPHQDPIATPSVPHRDPIKTPSRPHSDGVGDIEREKERENESDMESDMDMDKEKENISCPEPQAASGPPALLSFPVKANHGNPWHFTAEHCKRLQDAFSGIDIMAEARKSLSWLEAHSDRQKTPKGMPKFLHGWMTRANDSGRAAKVDDTPDIFAASRQEVSVEEARRILGHGEAA